MVDRTIRIGKVSSVDYGSGMIKVTYPDLDNSVTDDLPYLTFNDEYKMPKVGASVLVVHLSNGSAMGIVAGTYWNSSHRPPVSGKGVYRKDLAQAIGEAFLQYSGSSLQIHAPAITLDAGYKERKHHRGRNHQPHQRIGGIQMATYKVTARSGLRVRSKPNGTILTAMPYGTTVSGDGKKQGGWYHVKYKGRWGWSYGQYLKTVAEKKKTVASIAAKKKPARKPKTKKANSKKKTDTKKKTDESKNRAKAKGTLGCWGTDLIFEVNSKKILTAKDIKVSQDSRWTKHNILQNVPRGEFSGPDTMGVTLTITLSAEHGVKPRSMVEKIRKANRSGQVEYLVIGGKIMGSNKMAITATSEAWNAIYNKGELVKAKIDVTFMEYS